MTTSAKHLVKGCYVPKLGNKLVLYSNGICAYSQRVHLVLHAKKIPYQTIYVDVFKKPDWFTQKSPHGRVPVLELPDKTGSIIDSLIIVDYLEDKYPEHKLYPSDPYRRARDKVLIFRFNSVQDVIAKVMYPTTTVQQSNKEIINFKEVANEIFTNLDVFEMELRKRKTKFFGGAKPGMVDYMIWPWHERMMFFPMLDVSFNLDRKRFEKIIEWQDRMCTDFVVKSCSLAPEFYFELYQHIKGKKLSTDFMDKASECREYLKQAVTK